MSDAGAAGNTSTSTGGDGTTGESTGGDTDGSGGEAAGDAGTDPQVRAEAEAAGLAESIPDPAEITRKPTTLSGGLSLLGAVAVMLLGGIHSTLAFGLGTLGLAALALAVVFGSRSAADVGGATLLLSVVATGSVASAVPTLAAAVGTVFAWDLATNAIEMGEQLGREPDTGRAELVHAGATLAVGSLTAGTAFVVYNLATGGQPVTALVLLLLAALALASALRL